MVGWHHQLNGYEFEQTPEDREGQGTLACYIYSPWGRRIGLDRVTEQQQSICSSTFVEKTVPFLLNFHIVFFLMWAIFSLYLTCHYTVSLLCWSPLSTVFCSSSDDLLMIPAEC